MAGQKQHVDLHRKILLRQSCLKHAIPGAVFLPYCGDGDLAHLYAAGRKVPVVASSEGDDELQAGSETRAHSTMIGELESAFSGTSENLK